MARSSRHPPPPTYQHGKRCLTHDSYRFDQLRRRRRTRMHFPDPIAPSLLTIRTKRAIAVVGAVAFSCLFAAAASLSAPSSAMVPGGTYEDTGAGGTAGDFVCPHGVRVRVPLPSSCAEVGVHLTADATGTYFLPWSFEANTSCPTHRSQAWDDVLKPYAPSDRMKVSSTGTIHRIDRRAHGFHFEVQAALHNGGRLLKGWFSIRGPAVSGGGICSTGRVEFSAGTNGP
jgi:hypothetical protein